MSYPKNAASPPKLFASIVNATTGAAITSGVAAKYSTGAGSQAAGGGTCQHEGNGQWSYAPTQAETNVDGFGVQFYHADAVGSGPTVSVVTSASVAQTGDTYAVVAHTDYGNAKLVRSTTPTNTLDILATGEASANVTLWKDATAPAMTGDAFAVVTNATYGLDKLARTGADGDTLKTLSDQIDGVPTTADNATAAAAAILFNPAYKIATTEDSRVQSNVTHWDDDDVGAQDFTLPVIVSNLLAINSFDLPSHGISAASGTDLTVTILPAVDPAAYSGWLAYIEYTYWNGDFPFNGTWVAKVVSATATTITLASEIPENLSNLSEGIVYLVPMGSGLTAQETANAALLTPAGVAAAGSQMALAAAILEDTGTTLPQLIAAISQTVASTTDATTAGSITRRRGDSWAISLTIGAITGYTSLWFTAKWDRNNTDAQAVLQIKLNASGLNDGLLYVNGAAATDDTLASITVSDASTGAIVIAVDETVTDDLPPAGIYYDVQALVSGTVSTLDSGTLTISADVTRAVA